MYEFQSYLLKPSYRRISTWYFTGDSHNF